MKTALDCLPCLLNQTLFTSHLSISDKTVQASIVSEVAKLLPNLDLEKTPPENSIPVYKLIAELSGCPDPFFEKKQQSNDLALDMIKNQKIHVESATDPLLYALKLSIAGNIIDYGAHQDFDLDLAIEDSLRSTPAVDHYTRLLKDIEQAESILYLADNCGELIFDGLAIEQLRKSAKITLAVKESPIINDATIKDAQKCGLHEKITLISNGTSCPGTPLDLCSQEFLKVFNQADLIISKGQGNFETLSEVQAPIYFLLTVKCPIVAGHIDDLLNNKSQALVGVGDQILMKTPHWP